MNSKHQTTAEDDREQRLLCCAEECSTVLWAITRKGVHTNANTMVQIMVGAVVIAADCCCRERTAAVYLPGVNPQSSEVGGSLPLNVNAIASVHTHTHATPKELLSNAPTHRM